MECWKDLIILGRGEECFLMHDSKCRDWILQKKTLKEKIFGKPKIKFLPVLDFIDYLKYPSDIRIQEIVGLGCIDFKDAMDYFKYHVKKTNEEENVILEQIEERYPKEYKKWIGD